jgi:hypothetical protein
MKVNENVKISSAESPHTCERSHSLYTSPNTYSGQSKESVEESLGRLFTEIIERLEREGRLSEVLASLDNPSKEDANARNGISSEL